MKTIKAALLAAALACTSLAWSVTEPQEKIISLMNTYLAIQEGVHALQEGSKDTDPITHAYNNIDIDTLSFLPIYEPSGNWKESLPSFFEKELALDINDLECDASYDYTVYFTREDGTRLEVERYPADDAAELIRSIHLLSSLNLQHLRIPTIQAIARLGGSYDNILIVLEKPQGSTIANHLLDFNFTFPFSLKSLKMEKITNIYHSLGLALGELFTKSAIELPLHPRQEASHEYDFEEIQETLEKGSFMGITLEPLEELYTYYKDLLKATPLKHCFHFKYCDDYDYSFDPQNRTVSIENPSRLYWRIDLKKRPTTPQFMAYCEAVDELINGAFIFDELHREAFLTAFNQGYTESGGTLPTPQEEKIYRFFNGLKELEEIIDNESLHWLWLQCQEE